MPKPREGFINIRILISRVGIPIPGTVREYPEVEAKDLIERGLAELVSATARTRKPPAAKPAVQLPPEPEEDD